MKCFFIDWNKRLVPIKNNKNDYDFVQSQFIQASMFNKAGDGGKKTLN